MNRYEALKHAVKAHAGEKDKCGQPAILHPIAVAEALERTPIPADHAGIRHGTDDYLVTALLHDVWEDTEYELPINETSRLFLPLAAITRMVDEPYFGYIARVCGNHIASIVKLADLHHNLRPERLGRLPEEEARSLEKRYLKARDRIWKALGHSWWPESLEGER